MHQVPDEERPDQVQVNGAKEAREAADDLKNAP
jgi:hypothetical protein